MSDKIGDYIVEDRNEDTYVTTSLHRIVTDGKIIFTDGEGVQREIKVTNIRVHISPGLSLDGTVKIEAFSFKRHIRKLTKPANDCPVCANWSHLPYEQRPYAMYASATAGDGADSPLCNQHYCEHVEYMASHCSAAMNIALKK